MANPQIGSCLSAITGTSPFRRAKTTVLGTLASNLDRSDTPHYWYQPEDRTEDWAPRLESTSFPALHRRWILFPFSVIGAFEPERMKGSAASRADGVLALGA